MPVDFNHTLTLIQGCRAIFEETGYNILQPFHVDWNWVLANDDTLIIFLVFYLPVPDMIFDILHCEPLGWVSIQYTLDQISAVITHKVRDCVVCVKDFLVEYVCFGVFEWKVATDHGIKDHATTPNVSWKPMVILACHHLRSRVAGAATGCFKCLTSFIGVRKAEIDNLDVIVVIHQEVFGLQISVTDAKPVQVLYTRQNLVKEFSSHFLSDPLVVNDIFKQLATSRILHHQIKLLLRFNYFIQLHHHRMSDHFQDLDLPSNSLNIVYVLNLVFLEDFDGNLLSAG